MGKNPRDELLALIGQKTFDPVIDANPDECEGDRRRKLEDVRSTTRWSGKADELGVK